MRLEKKFGVWLLGLATFFALSASQALAAPTATVDIHVSIAANKSVSLAASSTYSMFGGMPLSSATVSSSSITVTNDSGAYIETYTLQGGAAVSDTAGVNWAIATTTGTNQYALGAVFSNTPPAATQTFWPYGSADLYLTGSPQVCSTTQFGNGVAGEAGASVLPTPGLNNRYLWFRMHTPGISTGTEGRTAQVTIAIQ
jgi:hypothetical protein